MARLEVRPEAELDALLRTTFARIEEAPQQFPIVSRAFRRAIVHRFPFGVFFMLKPNWQRSWLSHIFIVIRKSGSDASESN
ncbi:MAG: hypothetical protein DMF94_29320 [Acidobacteria bacterium]|nr:MAG: hypothetical protein DMF94_29320 [Acidobacteriota bacterium]